jgi:hypothetical protein
VVSTYVNEPLEGECLKLYRNSGKGGLGEVSKEVGLDRSFMPMGCNFGDFDNHGYLDFYLGNGGAFLSVDRPELLIQES